MSAILFLFGMLLWAVAVDPVIAKETCAPDPTDMQLRLDMPLGCLTRAIFNRQIDKPDDRITPRAETPADAERRLKSLLEWRDAKPTPMQSGESPKQ